MTTAQVVDHPLEETAAWLSDVASDPVEIRVDGVAEHGEGD